MPRKKEPKPAPVRLEPVALPTKKCCICGKEFVGFGNDPWPLSEKRTDVCCDDCNYEKVIPARMKAIADDPGQDSYERARRSWDERPDQQSGPVQ